MWPKTLLNGTFRPLGLTAASPLQHHSVSTHCFIPSPATFSRLPNQSPLNQPAPAATAEYLSLETDDRCGSYDDVLIEGGDDVTVAASDIADTEFDDGCSAREEPQNTRFLEGFVTSERNWTASFEGTMIHEAAINDSLKSTKVIERNVSVRSEGETSRQSLISAPIPFAVPGSVPLRDIKNGRRSTWLDASVKLLAKSRGTRESAPKTKTVNASIQVKYAAGNTSTLTSETLVTPRHQGHKGAPKPSFKIFSENPSRCSSSRSLCAPTHTHPLRSRPVNTLSTCGGDAAQKVTSPLCSCGRRAKRQLVSNGGPNHGRGFYCCPVRRSASGGQVRKGCEFFKWESAVMRGSSRLCPAVDSSSASFCHVIKSSRIVSSVQRKSF